MKAIRATETWARAGVYYVRTEAMVLGFDLPMQGEFADDDENSEYILVLDDTGKPLSTNRIHLLPEHQIAKIERVATVSSARKLGAGRIGIEAAEEWILEKGYHHIVITSREEAVGFYEKIGYTARYDIDPHIFDKPKEAGEPKKPVDPRFITVYMEKTL